MSGLSLKPKKKVFQEGVSSLESVPWGHLSHHDSGWLLELSVLGVPCTHFGSDSAMNATSSLELNGLQPVTITVGTAAAVRGQKVPIL